MLQWCRTRDLLGSQNAVITGGFEQQISCIRSSYLKRSCNERKTTARSQKNKFSYFSYFSLTSQKNIVSSR